MQEFDHMKLVKRDEAEVTRFVRAVDEAGATLAISIGHDEDDGCCRIERWQDTANFLDGLCRRATNELNIDNRISYDVPLASSPERN